MVVAAAEEVAEVVAASAVVEEDVEAVDSVIMDHQNVSSKWEPFLIHVKRILWLNLVLVMYPTSMLPSTLKINNRLERLMKYLEVSVNIWFLLNVPKM